MQQSHADPETLRIDMPVCVVFSDAGYPAFETGVKVPLFTPADTVA